MGADNDKVADTNSQQKPEDALLMAAEEKDKLNCEIHDNYFIGEKFYYRREILDGIEERFFIYDFNQDMDEQLDFITQHHINSFSFSGTVKSEYTEDKFNSDSQQFLTVMEQLPKDLIALNLTVYKIYDNLEFLRRFASIRQLNIHCVLQNNFDFRIFENLAHVTLWYGKAFESILQCPKLQSLCIFKPDNKAIGHIGRLSYLQTLAIRQASIKDIDALTHLKSLRSLELRYLPKLTSIAPLVYLTALKNVAFQNCIHIEDWYILDKLSHLETLTFENCRSVEVSEALAQRLKHLYLIGNT